VSHEEGPTAIFAKTPFARPRYSGCTRSALRYMTLDSARLGMVPHTERYEHFGEVACELIDFGRGVLTGTSG
jgi:hypothetical protein